MLEESVASKIKAVPIPETWSSTSTRANLSVRAASPACSCKCPFWSWMQAINRLYNYGSTVPAYLLPYSLTCTPLPQGRHKDTHHFETASILVNQALHIHCRVGNVHSFFGAATVLAAAAAAAGTVAAATGRFLAHTLHSFTALSTRARDSRAPISTSRFTHRSRRPIASPRSARFTRSDPQRPRLTHTLADAVRRGA